MNQRATRPIGLAALAACLLLPGCGRDADEMSESTAATLEELEADGAESRAEAIRQLDEQGYAEPDLDTIARSSEKLAAAAEEATGEEKAILEVAAAYNLIVRDRAAAYYSTVDAIANAGSLDATTLQTEEDVRARLDLFDAMVEATIVFERQLRTIEGDVRQRLVRAGVAGEKATTIARGYAEEFQLEDALAIRQSDKRFAEAAKEMLLILEGHIGLFEVAEDGTVVFDYSVPQETIDRYSAAADRVNEESELQTVIQRRMFGG